MQQVGWNGFDTKWVGALFGTAIGAGILFLPINAGEGGFWPLLVTTLMVGPMSYFSHRALSRIICESPRPSQDITSVVTDYFGMRAGNLITILYFLSVYPIVLIYGVGITNTMDSFLVHQLGISALPRWLLAGMLVFLMSLVMMIGKEFMLIVTQWLIYPLIFALAFVTVYLIPYWNLEGFGHFTGWGNFSLSAWLILPVLVFSFNHSPAISQFSVSLKSRYGDGSNKKATQILSVTSGALFFFTMSFVWSCVLALGPSGLDKARESNLPVLSYLANELNAPFIGWLGPVIAIAAIGSSFFGCWLGAHEGGMGLFRNFIDAGGRQLSDKRLYWVVTVFIFASTWIVSVLNPNILSLLETMMGPVVAVLLYLMPMYAIHKVEALKPYRKRISNIYITVTGLLTVGGIFIGFLN